MVSSSRSYYGTRNRLPMTLRLGTRISFPSRPYGGFRRHGPEPDTPFHCFVLVLRVLASVVFIGICMHTTSTGSVTTFASWIETLLGRFGKILHLYKIEASRQQNGWNTSYGFGPSRFYFSLICRFMGIGRLEGRSGLPLPRTAKYPSSVRFRYCVPAGMAADNDA